MLPWGVPWNRKLSRFYSLNLVTDFVTEFCNSEFGNWTSNDRLNGSTKIISPKLSHKQPNRYLKQHSSSCPNSMKFMLFNFLWATRIVCFQSYASMHIGSDLPSEPLRNLLRDQSRSYSWSNSARRDRLASMQISIAMNMRKVTSNDFNGRTSIKRHCV